MGCLKKYKYRGCRNVKFRPLALYSQLDKRGNNDKLGELKIDNKLREIDHDIGEEIEIASR